jgi:hypothetical protein
LSEKYVIYRTKKTISASLGNSSKFYKIVVVQKITKIIGKFLVGGSIPNGEEDISPYATFHLLGMREENKGNMGAGAGHPSNFQTLPSQPGMPGPQTGPNTPAHQRHTSQTMNVSGISQFICLVWLVAKVGLFE